MEKELIKYFMEFDKLADNEDYINGVIWGANISLLLSSKKKNKKDIIETLTEFLSKLQVMKNEI